MNFWGTGSVTWVSSPGPCELSIVVHASLDHILPSAFSISSCLPAVSFKNSVVESSCKMVRLHISGKFFEVSDSPNALVPVGFLPM